MYTTTFVVPAFLYKAPAGRSQVIKLAIAAMCCCIPLVTGSAVAQDVLMHHNDQVRSGVQSHETQLTPSTIATKTFGRLFSLRVDGQVYAQPLWVGSYTMNDGKAHNVLFVATEHDSVFAFDADGRQPAAGSYWHVSLLGTGETSMPSGDTGTTDITPEVGITGTPVIDRAAGVLYLVAKSRLVTASGTTYIQRLHALSLATGQEVNKGPAVIQASVPGTGDDSDGKNVPFDARTAGQRASLVLANGSVWIAWASHGDNRPYHGWLLGYSASNLNRQTGVFNTTPNGAEGGIWMSGGGISADASGNLYAASGNGDFDASTGGSSYSSTVFKFTPGPSGVSLASSFTPYNEANLSGQDLDLGTSACTLIDDPTGPLPHLLVTTDKDGTIYLLDRDKLGGFSVNSNQDVQDFSDGGYNIHESAAFFNNHLYLGPDGGPLSSWAFDPVKGQFSTTPATATDSSFGCDGCDGAGATPSISANGTSNAIVWVIDNSGFNISPAILHAFDPTLATELYNSTWAASNRDQADIAVKFTTPTIANGFVYVGGGSSVTVYGLFKNAPTTVQTPTLSPAPGDTSAASLSVTLSDATPGASIHYTLDGSIPTAGSRVYTAPLVLSATTNLQAIATAPGLVSSGAAGGLYLFGTPGNVIAINNGFSSTQFNLNGSAKVTSNRLRLADGNGGEAGSAWFHLPALITNFTTSFDFQLTNALADGVTFAFQNQGPTALGPTGGGLGYGPDTPGQTPGISPSAAVKFDLYDNQGEGIDSTGLYTGGASPTVPAVDLSGAGIDLHSGHIFSAQFIYNGQTLYQTITDTVTRKSFGHSYPVNLVKALGGNSALIGFTAGTGGEAVVADILNWSYSNPVVENFAMSALSAKVSGPALTPYSNASFPGGTGVLFPATVKGQSVSFAVTVAAPATFAVQLLADTGINRGIVQLSIDGKNFGNLYDNYTTTPGTLNHNFGNILLGAGAHAFTFTVVGKDAASTSFHATFGQLTLVP